MSDQSSFALENRRQSERLVLRNFPNVYCITGSKEAMPVELIDVSREGCTFRIAFETGRYFTSHLKQIPARFCFCEDSHIQLELHAVNTRPYVENGKKYLIVGCAVNTLSPDFVVYEKFIVFLQFYSQHARRELGEIDVTYV